MQSERFNDYAVVGELALEGHARPVKGRSIDGHVDARCRAEGSGRPKENAAEAAVVEEIEVIPVASLTEAIGFFTA